VELSESCPPNGRKEGSVVSANRFLFGNEMQLKRDLSAQLRLFHRALQPVSPAHHKALMASVGQSREKRERHSNLVNALQGRHILLKGISGIFDLQIRTEEA